MILSIPLSHLLLAYEHVEPHLNENKMSLKGFVENSITVMGKVETSDSRTYSSNPSYYLDTEPPAWLSVTTPLSELELKIQQTNPTNCYEDMDAAIIHHQLTALALEVYYELVNFLEVYKIVNHPLLHRDVVGWRGQDMLLRVCSRN